MTQQKTYIVWLTGLSAAGKTTIGRLLREKLDNQGFKIYHLDGDEVRAASKEKLGFSKEGRDKNIDLAIKMADEYQKQGFIVLASFVSPYKHHREWGRVRLENYIEVFVNAPLEVCEQRDPKGLYKKARAGEIEFFTGISDPYEEPESPDIEIRTDQLSPDQCIEQIIEYLKQNRLLEDKDK